MEELIRPYKKFYYNQPPWVHKFVGQIINKLPASLRYGQTFRRTSKILDESQWWSEEEIKSYHAQQLNKLLHHATQTVPYYQHFYSKASNWENPFELLKQFPLISREIIREHLDELLSREISDSHFVSITTGGSTGTPMKFYHHRGLTNPAERAFQWRQRSWAGYNYGNRVVILRGRGLGGNRCWVDEPADNALVISAYHLDEAHLPKIVDKIRRFDPVAIQAYPSNATILANYLKRNNLSSFDNLRVLLCGSENLFEFQRDYLEDVFGCRVYSWYGLTEYVVLAGGCDQSDMYHIYPEYGITELVRPDGSVIDAPGEVGEIVGTSFFNYAMPFIRYKTGDLAEYADGYCECSRKYKRFKKVLGREQEFVITTDGRLIALTGVIFGQHFDAFKFIQKFQLRQSVPGKVEIALVPSREYSETSEMEIMQEFHNCVGPGIDLSFVYEDTIKPTPAGKHKFLIQELEIHPKIKLATTMKE